MSGLDGCLLWTGSVVTHRGVSYGNFKVDGRSTLVHRWVYQYTYGVTLGPGQVVRHTCDVSLCVHPDHLLVGTQADNVADCIERGRAWWQVTERPRQPTSG